MPFEIMMRMTSLRPPPATTELAICWPNTSTPSNRNTPISTWLTLALLTVAPPISMALEAMKPSWRGAVYSCA